MTEATSNPAAEKILQLYQALHDAWNRQDAAGMAALIAADGEVIGFDGSQMTGPSEVETTLGGIFAHHKTAAYVAIVRTLRFIGPDTAILRAVVGMTPPGKSEINPAVNAIQTIVASRRNGKWLIEQFQNTPTAYHGRPEASEALTHELQVIADARLISVRVDPDL